MEVVPVLVMLQRLLVSFEYHLFPLICHLSCSLSPSSSSFSLCFLLIGAGADFVMLGGMFAGHDQSGGEIVEKDGCKYKLFYGMSSATAMQRYSGGVAEYRYY